MEAKEKGEKWGLRSKREMVDNKTESRTGLLNSMSYLKKYTPMNVSYSVRSLQIIS